jgi:hypothetical protein
MGSFFDRRDGLPLCLESLHSKIRLATVLREETCSHRYHAVRNAYPTALFLLPRANNLKLSGVDPDPRFWRGRSPITVLEENVLACRRWVRIPAIKILRWGRQAKLLQFLSVGRVESQRRPGLRYELSAVRSHNLGNLDSPRPACVDLTFPVSASRRIARSRNGWLGSELSRLDREGLAPSCVTNVAMIVLSSRNHSEVLGLPCLSRLRPNTSPWGALPIAARRSAVHFAATVWLAVLTVGPLGLLRKCTNKKSAT